MPKPADKYTDDKEVLEALNNALVATTNWKRVAPARAATPNRFYAFTKQFVQNVRDAATEIEVKVPGMPGEPVQVVPNSELAHCLLLATILILYDDVSLWNGPRRNFWMADVIKSVSETPVPTVEELEGTIGDA